MNAHALRTDALHRTEAFRRQTGTYSADGHGVIGHISIDVWEWLEAHPEFDGYLYFDFGDGSGPMDCTDFFIGPDAAVPQASNRVLETV